VTWGYEDGGPRRLQRCDGALAIEAGVHLEVTTRIAPAVTMVVTRDDDEVFLLRHTAGDGATSCVERIDPITLEAIAASPALPGGPVWPGGIGAAGDGSVHVVFGNHAHRLDSDLRRVASRELPRHRPYNSFVVLTGGMLVTKDFAGSRPGVEITAAERDPSELVVLDPVDLAIVARLELPEPSIARLSADGNDIYVVGDTSLLRVRWDGRSLALDRDFVAPYRTMDGQSFGWDCVLASGAAWFLDNGDGSHRFSGTLRGNGLSTAPLHLVRVDLVTGEVALGEVCAAEGGLVANPPVVDEARGIAVGYDSGNGVVRAFSTAALEPVWTRQQDHGSHMLLYQETGELVTGDGDDVVVLDISSGHELGRVSTASGMQSVLFPCPGSRRDFYVCSFAAVSRIAVVAD